MRLSMRKRGFPVAWVWKCVTSHSLLVLVKGYWMGTGLFCQWVSVRDVPWHRYILFSSGCFGCVHDKSLFPYLVEGFSEDKPPIGHPLAKIFT